MQRSKNQSKLVKVSSLLPPETLNKYDSSLKRNADIPTISNLTEPDSAKRKEGFAYHVKANSYRFLNTAQKNVLENFYNEISKYPTAEDFKNLGIQVFITCFIILEYLKIY